MTITTVTVTVKASELVTGDTVIIGQTKTELAYAVLGRECITLCDRRGRIICRVGKDEEFDVVRPTVVLTAEELFRLKDSHGLRGGPDQGPH